jgi:hypothetical protein
VLGRFSDPDPCLAVGNSFCELANLGQGPEQKGTGEHGDRAGRADMLTEALTARLSCEGIYGLP